MKLEIEYIPISEIKLYPNNAKIHTAEQIEQIKKSIQEFGFNDPVGIWHGECVEGHGRIIAATELGLETVPVIRLDELTDEQRRAYMLVHNKLTMNTDFDADLLSMELDDIDGIEMTDFGFQILDAFDLKFDLDDEKTKYTTDVKLPQYEVKGEHYTLDDLVETGKLGELLNEIEKSNVDEAQKEFLKICAYRHVVINFKRCAEYYASTSAEMQELMEHNALVFIDVDDAIANGFARLASRLETQLDGEYFEYELCCIYSNARKGR